MMNDINYLIEKLSTKHSLSLTEYETIVENFDETNAAILQKFANKVRKAFYGNKIFIRGLIEVSNICKNDCYYCGIRRSNKNVDRYRLTGEEIISCVKEGYGLGFRTFVMQGGEDGVFTDDFLTEVIREIKRNYPDVAVTLSLGERSKESYLALKKAGADRYLLRHETADSKHYGRLHPAGLSLENRLACLKSLREVGFYVGCGFMVGSPYQTAGTIAKDLKFIEELKPEMCGIGPFISQKDTPFKNMPSGGADFTCYLLSVIRLIYPPILLPSTTALGTIESFGREKGILAGANVIMPNLSPMSVRKKYALYDKKLCTGSEAAEGLAELKMRMAAIGFEIVTDRGDIKLSKRKEKSDLKKGETNV